MARKYDYSLEEKVFYLEEAERAGVRGTARKYSMPVSILNSWLLRFRANGIEGLKDRSSNKSYSNEEKENAVKEYLSGNGSLKEICIKYKIRSTTQLRRWIKKYNGHENLNSYKSGGTKSMTKGRATSFKERIEIALCCISNNYDYQKTAETHGVSYQQVYQWVKKIETNGEDALKDGRGRKKSEEELTDADRLDIKMKRLEAENERLRAENLLLKKLEEIERWRS